MYNLYSIPQCQQASAMVRAIRTTVTVKAGHKSKVWEIKAVLEKIEVLNQFVFAPEYEPHYLDYNTAVCRDYHTLTKTQLDNILRRTIRGIADSIGECIKMENMTHDGRLVRNPEYVPGSVKSEWIDAGRLNG
jgi:hypothetical protein